MNKKSVLVGVILVLGVMMASTVSATMLSWTASQGDVEGYKIYWSKEEGVYTEENSVDVGNVTQYSLCLLPINQDESFFFAVKTYGTEWGEAAESVVSSSLCDDSVAPEVTVNGYASGAIIHTQDETITLTGTAIDNKEIVKIVWESYWPNYQISWIYPDNKVALGSGVADGTSTWTITDIPIKPDVTISYRSYIRIRAYDFCGNSTEIVLMPDFKEQ